MDSVRAELIVNNQVENKPLYVQADCCNSSCVALHTHYDLWRNKVVFILSHFKRAHCTLFDMILIFLNF